MRFGRTRRGGKLASFLVLTSATCFGLFSGPFGAPFERAAYAQDKPASPKAQAAALYQESVVSYRKGDFATTVDLLKRAYALDPEPVLLYNLARAYEGLGDIDAAIDTYTKYLAADPQAKDRGAIEQRLTTLRRERDERIALQKQNETERARAEEARRQAAAKKNEPPPPAPKSRSAAPYLVGGVGVAGIGTGVVFFLMASSQHSNAESEPIQQIAEQDQNRAKTYSTASTVAFIAGGALLAIGATWWILDTPKNPPSTQPAARVGVGPGHVNLEVTFR